MRSHPPRSNELNSRDMPHPRLGGVSNAVITPHIGTITDTRFSHNARSAETARAISGWSSDGYIFPSTENGLHEGFITRTDDRKETRERLVANMLDAVRGLSWAIPIVANLWAYSGCRT
jgi:hypothetical protein